MRLASYGSTIAVVNKEGKLRCDPDGYYTICAGGANTHNSAGAWYDGPSYMNQFNQSTAFMRRIGNKALYGECGHPVYQPGMSKRDWLIRVMTIDPQKHAAHIKEVFIDQESHRNKDGSPIVAIYIRVAPRGPYAQQLGDSLDNPDENTAFSVRSITDDYFDPKRGCTVKMMREIVTFDYVGEPGIAIATKYNSVTLEDREITTFSDRDITDAIRHARETCLGMESDDLANRLESLRQPIQRPSGLILPRAALPRSAHWM